MSPIFINQHTTIDDPAVLINFWNLAFFGAAYSHVMNSPMVRQLPCPLYEHRPNRWGFVALLVVGVFAIWLMKRPPPSCFLSGHTGFISFCAARPPICRASSEEQCVKCVGRKFNDFATHPTGIYGFAGGALL